MALYAGRRLEVNGEVRQPGDPVPEARDWPRLRTYLKLGRIVELADPPKSSKPKPKPKPKISPKPKPKISTPKPKISAPSWGASSKSSAASSPKKKRKTKPAEES